MPHNLDNSFKVGYKAKDKKGNTWKLTSKNKGVNKWIKMDGTKELEYSPDVDYEHKLSPLLMYAALSKTDPEIKDKFTVLDLYDIDKIITPDTISSYIDANETLRILKNMVIPELETMGKAVYIIPSPIDRQGRHWSDFPNDYMDQYYKKENWYDNFIYFIFYLDKNLNIYHNRKITGRFSKMSKQELTEVYEIITKYLPNKVTWDKSNRNAIMIGGSGYDADTEDNYSQDSEIEDSTLDVDPYVVGFYYLSKTDIEKHGRPDHLVSHDDFMSCPDIAKMLKLLGDFGSTVSYSMAEEPNHILTIVVSKVNNKEAVAKAIRKQSSISIKGKVFRIRKTIFVYAQKGITKEIMKHGSDKFIKKN